LRGEKRSNTREKRLNAVRAGKASVRWGESRKVTWKRKIGKDSEREKKVNENVGGKRTSQCP